MTNRLWFIGVVVLAILGLATLLIRLEKTGDEGQAGLMSQRTRATLITYLLGVGFLLLYLFVQTYAVDFPQGIAMVGPVESTKGECTASPLPALRLINVFPYLTAPAPGKPSTYQLVAYGDGFNGEASVRLNGDSTKTKALLVNCSLMTVSLDVGDLERLGTLIVEVVQATPATDPKASATTTVSNAVMLTIVPRREELTVLWQTWLITKEMQLLLLVMFAGALGSFVHALKSLGDYIGNRTAVSSWFWFYISRPFIGATMAMIFYSVIRGGFLTGTAADANIVNPFGAVAVAALVGMFADKAAQKLAQVFEVFFKTEDQRSGKLASPAIQKLDPATVRTGSTSPVDVKIVGDRLGKATAVKVNGIDRSPQHATDKEVVVRLLPADLAATKDLTISVVTPDGTSPALALHVSDLQITGPAAAPNGTVQTPYSLLPTVQGGTAPYKWTMEGKFPGCDIDSKTGEVKGTPTTAGAATIVLTVTDKTGASDSASFEIQIA